jgi:hypothetical protein
MCPVSFLTQGVRHIVFCKMVNGSMQTLHLLFIFGVLFMFEKTDSALYRVCNMEGNMQHSFIFVKWQIFQ